MKHQGTGIFIALLLTGCAQLDTVDSTWIGDSTTCNEAVEFYTAVSLLSTATKEELLHTLRSNRSQEGNPCNQLRLAMLLSKPNTNFRDDVTASTLLKNFLANPGNTHAPSRSLAHLLSDRINEHQQLQEAMRSLEKTISQEMAISQTLAKKLKRQHTTTKALQSQLDQLKSIERDINEKEQSAATPAASEKINESNQNTPD